MNKDVVINHMKEKVEEIVRRNIKESFTDKQVNNRVVVKEIVTELEKVIEDEDKKN